MSVAAADPDVVGQARPGPFASWWRRVDPADLARIGFVGACALAVVVLAAVGSPAWLRVVVGVAGLVVGCWSIAAEAALDVWHRRMSMELSMLLAIAAAAAIGEWVTALVITAFVIAAEMLEDLSMDRGRTALSDLLAFLPQTVLVIRDGLPVETPLEEVRVADRVLIRPGGRVPVDGTVREGASDLDVSRITGEPVPVAVTAGDTVAAGSISLTGGLELTVERTGSNSSYGRIVAAVRAAQQSEAPVQRLADRLAGWLVLVALAAAALT
jgi:Cu+-exporting ATPase